MSPTRPLDDQTRCPCGTGETYGACCGPLHRGAAASTAERLMRSRFTAFVTGDTDYLRATWTPETAPEEITLDQRIRWTRLEVRATTDGGPFDDHGTVEFEAFYRPLERMIGLQPGSQKELSRFVRRGGRWLYERGDASLT